jgi:hypothetical protein
MTILRLKTQCRASVKGATDNKVKGNPVPSSAEGAADI